MLEHLIVEQAEVTRRWNVCLPRTLSLMELIVLLLAR